MGIDVGAQVLMNEGPDAPLRRWDWSVSGGVIDCILVGFSLVVLSYLSFLGLYWYRSPTDPSCL